MPPIVARRSDDHVVRIAKRDQPGCALAGNTGVRHVHRQIDVLADEECRFSVEGPGMPQYVQ
jgi:hypothetical protein